MFPIVHKRQLSDAVFEMGVQAPRDRREGARGPVPHAPHRRARRAHPAHLLRLVRRGGLDPVHLHARGQDHAPALAPRGRRLRARRRRAARRADAHRGRRARRGRRRRRGCRGGLPGRSCDGRGGRRGQRHHRRAQQGAAHPRRRAAGAAARALRHRHRRRLGGPQGARDAPAQGAVRGRRARRGVRHRPGDHDEVLRGHHA